MAIDTKNIQYFVWKIVKFSMNSCCRFVQKHPFVSGTVSLFFLLYLFLPSVFFFLIYASPVIVCIYVFLRYYVEPKQPEIKNDKRVDEKSSVESKSLPADAAVVVSRNGNKPVMHDDQISRRKNVIKELEAEGNNKETGVILGTTPADASIIGSQNVFTEEKGSASVDHGESSLWNVSGADNVQPLDQRVSVSAEHSEKGNDAAGCEEEEESSDEEEMQRDGNNAVEWTADDQQNLMDLGDSELERNKRLESLIARRRARKLFKMAVEKRVTESGSGGQMPPLSIVRNTILNNIPNNQDFVEDIQVPGSAPSVLLPARNPFDIPYEPYEERPNLTGDSFHEEFSIHQRELLFCRHESFFLGPSFSVESQQDQHESYVGPYGVDKRTALGPRLSRYRTVSGKTVNFFFVSNLCLNHVLIKKRKSISQI
ncbi:hypothetical protein CISIN_1g035987mg [Citrus sinensis]|uniref:Uncharacterized protein n=1 Tax=Citrus sinensis TaxID=2711 RepID=A0A067FTM8_CITSI|nr:hypothetical protein CISIN_1g035987mg [Citrus sinensis]